MASRTPFRIDPTWPFPRFIEALFAHYTGGGIESTGYRLNAIRNWLSMVGRNRAIEAFHTLEADAGTTDESQLAKSLWMSRRSYRGLKKYADNLPADDTTPAPGASPIQVFLAYKWESGEHVAWVRKLAADLRGRGIDATLDQWVVRYGDSFTDYMQRHIATADAIL